MARGGKDKFLQSLCLHLSLYLYLYLCIYTYRNVCLWERRDSHVLLEVDGIAAHDSSHLRLAFDVDHLVLGQAEAPVNC